ncbi:MAG: hypothetical protein M1817_003301 [Caeruleum heppii]|nr:MAG: hypothetical protein M1817_003301 [Caeruleum heppii]
MTDLKPEADQPNASATTLSNDTTADLNVTDKPEMASVPEVQDAAKESSVAKEVAEGIDSEAKGNASGTPATNGTPSKEHSIANGNSEAAKGSSEEGASASKSEGEAKATDQIKDASNDATPKTDQSPNGTRSAPRGRGQISRGVRGRDGRRGGYRSQMTGKEIKEKYRENNKFDPSQAEETSDPVLIRKQVEFYFSDSNLPMDKFLLEQVGGVENKPVPIQTIHNFKRMKRFQPYEAVVEALKESTFLDVTEDGSIQRKVPIDEAALGKSVEEGQKWVEDKSLPRSIYAKGFDDETPTTQFDIEAFFAPHGPTNAIRLRRTPLGVFKHSVFVEFADEALQQAFMALDPKPKWKGTTELLWLSKKAYVEGKAADFAAGKLKFTKHERDWGAIRRSIVPRGGDKDGDPDDWKKRRQDDQSRGFRDDKRGRFDKGFGFNSRGRGRGGRGGRGGREDRRGRGGNHGGRGNDPHKVPTLQTPESMDEATIRKTSPKDADTPSRAPSTSMAAPTDTTPSKKRAREDDGAGEAEESTRKKVDTKIGGDEGGS